MPNKPKTTKQENNNKKIHNSGNVATKCWLRAKANASKNNANSNDDDDVASVTNSYRWQGNKKGQDKGDKGDGKARAVGQGMWQGVGQTNSKLLSAYFIVYANANEAAKCFAFAIAIDF